MEVATQCKRRKQERRDGRLPEDDDRWKHIDDRWKHIALSSQVKAAILASNVVDAADELMREKAKGTMAANVRRTPGFNVISRCIKSLTFLRHEHTPDVFDVEMETVKGREKWNGVQLSIPQDVPLRCALQVLAMSFLIQIRSSVLAVAEMGNEAGEMTSHSIAMAVMKGDHLLQDDSRQAEELWGDTEKLCRLFNDMRWTRGWDKREVFGQLLGKSFLEPCLDKKYCTCMQPGCKLPQLLFGVTPLLMEDMTFYTDLYWFSSAEKINVILHQEGTFIVEGLHGDIVIT